MKRFTSLLLLTIVLYFLSSGVVFATDDVTVPDQTVSSGQSETYVGMDSVTANDFDVLNGGEANFISGSDGTIRLKPGFKATEGCKFSAKIKSDFVYWKGAGADTNWSNGANWESGHPPKTTDIVYFGPDSKGDCTLDQNVIVAGLILDGYKGTFSNNGKSFEVIENSINK